MIRYNKFITLNRTANGQTTITGDRQVVAYKTREFLRLNPDFELIREWWDRQYQSDLRHWQKDLCVQLLPSAFLSIDLNWNYVLHLVYAEGEGYTQPHDLCYVKLQNPEVDYDIHIVSTQEHTWIDYQPKNTAKFSLRVEDALPSVESRKGQDAVWQLYDDVRKVAQQ